MLHQDGGDLVSYTTLSTLQERKRRKELGLPELEAKLVESSVKMCEIQLP